MDKSKNNSNSVDITILGIESSCDDTSAAVVKNGMLLSNSIASQDVHIRYGGVVPELASREHQKNIVPVVDIALRQAGVSLSEISGIAFTRGPGLLGSLLVGTSFAKGLALSLGIPLIEVNHLQSHVLSQFIDEGNAPSFPAFPFLSLLVSGGHTQIMKIDDYLRLTVLGRTIDDAAGEAFDKCAKVMGLPYPGGPAIDQLAKNGDPLKFMFSRPKIPGLDFSFSGLKTSFLYFLRDKIKENGTFIENNKSDLCSSIQFVICDILKSKVTSALRETGLTSVSVTGGVSANSCLRSLFSELAMKEGINVFFPERKFTTDNAAMVAMTGFFKYKNGVFCSHDVTPKPRYPLDTIL